MTIEPIYVNYVLIPAGILLGAFIISKILRLILGRFVKKASGKLNMDPTRFNFVKNALSFIIFILAVIIIFHTIPELHDYGVTLFASAGVFAAIVGFASQSAFSNIISGIFIVIFRPFRVGDIINIGTSYSGEVEDITLRHTIIRNFENRRIVIPNNIISEETIVNSTLTENKTCIYLEIGISYDSDVDLAIQIIQEEAMKHSLFLDNRTRQDKKEGALAVIVRLIGFGDSSVNLRAYIWSPSPQEGFVMKCDLHKSIKARFDKEGVEIPFPHRTIVHKENLKK